MIGLGLLRLLVYLGVLNNSVGYSLPAKPTVSHPEYQSFVTTSIA
jgi:hypothetical protein